MRIVSATRKYPRKTPFISETDKLLFSSIIIVYNFAVWKNIVSKMCASFPRKKTAPENDTQVLFWIRGHVEPAWHSWVSKRSDGHHEFGQTRQMCGRRFNRFVFPLLSRFFFMVSQTIIHRAWLQVVFLLAVRLQVVFSSFRRNFVILGRFDLPRSALRSIFHVDHEFHIR